ncbi:MAG: ATP-dependent Clp protease adapter ClpS [Gammaproteobacteria bacterium]|jgi:ATP-dependent Clp protease adaptor protein ClpS
MMTMTYLTQFNPAIQLVIRSQNDGNDDEHQRGSSIREALAPDQAKIKPPPLYRVILLNDDYTPMEFVVEILRVFFGMNAETATRVMLKVHTEGKGVCGVFPKEIAETKASQVNEYARAEEHPLMCDIEADD